MSVLTPGQAQIVSVASRGHNLLITGQAGTGKSTVVEEIISNLNAVGLKVAVVCSSGTAYEPGKASTVHSHDGLGVADLPWKQLVEKLWCNPYQLISSSSKASRIEELLAECKETVFEFDFPVFALSVTRLVLHYKGASKCSRGVVGKE